MNQWTVSGNLAKDPWVAESGKKLTLTVAVSKGYSMEKEKEAKAKGIPTADYFELTLFSEPMIKWVRNLQKGDGILATCRLQPERSGTRLNDEGVKEVYIKEAKVIQRLEVTNKRSSRGSDIAEHGEYDGESDPIEVSYAAPAPQQATPAVTANPDEW